MSSGAAARVFRVRALGAAVGAALVGATLVVLALGPTEESPSREQHPLPPPVSAAGLAERSGVRVLRVAITAGGGLIDLRYQVVDPGKAAAIHDTGTPPALVYEATGAPIEGLLMGHVPHNPAKAGVTSAMIFVNPGNIVRRGDRISVVLGGARLKHVAVQ